MGILQVSFKFEIGQTVVYKGKSTVISQRRVTEIHKQEFQKKYLISGLVTNKWARESDLKFAPKIELAVDATPTHAQLVKFASRVKKRGTTK